jgi:C-terminal processing protease CtpA/Prc
LGTAFGPNEEGVAIDLSWRTLGGEERSARLVKRPVTIPTVSHTSVYDVGGRKVGYIMFRNFVEPSVAALDAAFAQLKAAGATELVLDLRYNGGGLVSVAQHLASLIGGRRTQDQLFAEFFHNDRHPELNRLVRFEEKANTLNLTRLVVVTTRASASASELVINALRPFIPVTIVGDTTFGKPVGQYGFPFCDKVLNPVAFILRNADGQSDFFNGFAPDCRAADDLEHAFGDLQEASLAESLTFLRTGACTQAAATAAKARVVERPIQLGDGWQQLLGAH